MAAAPDPLKSLPAELRLIRRLNSSLDRDASGCRGQGRAGPPRHHPPLTRSSTAPLRVDVPLLDPCCGLLSAGAEAALGVKDRRSFINLNHVPSGLQGPAGLRPQTTPNPSWMCGNVSGEKAWSSRKIPGAALRTKLSGSRGGAETSPPSPRASSEATQRCRAPDKHARLQDASASGVWTDSSLEVLRRKYTSASQRSHEEVRRDTTFPGRWKAADKSLEELVNLVCERPSPRRYYSRPQLWQSVGAEWSRQQLRLRSDATKPVSFCSHYPRSGQIPLYTGTIGSSEDMENIDNTDEEFHPLTLKRSVIPPYTPTAHRSTVPGYTGKAAHIPSATAAQPPSHPEASFHADKESGVFGRAAPLSRLVTATTPRNPFLRLPVSRTGARGGIRRGR